MFLKNQSEENKKEYFHFLKSIGSLSKLFTDSSVPYLYYRVAENIFCKAFIADNLSRSDVAVDARKDSIGIGLKTFLENNGKTLQKVAEFNRNRDEYKKLENKPKQLVKLIADMRNERIRSAKSIHAMEDVIYHCVTRAKNKFFIYEQKMDSINIDKIKQVKIKGNAISFHDGLNEYNFNISKSTLFKRFITKNPYVVKVDIIKDPYPVIDNFYKEYIETKILELEKQSDDFVVLPLYSKRKGVHVPVGSGLNQWNAKGRIRHPKEVYIPIPKWIHKKFPTFFPGKDVPFKLHLPNDKVLSAKICQDDNKALMSNPNKALGEWLRDEVLNVKDGVLVTYNMLKKINIDSVEIIKKDRNNYFINFKSLGTFEEFEQDKKN